jgi:AcrR family transcriptional regulator
MNQPTAGFRTRLTAEQRRRAILGAAKRVFGRAGYHEATTRDIAAAANVSEALLYQHFPGKRQLFEELIREAAADLERRLLEAQESPNPGMASFFDFVEAESELFRVFFRQALQADPAFRGLYLSTALRLVQRPAGEPPLSEAGAHALAGMLSELALWWLDEATVGKQEIIERAERMARAVCSVEVEQVGAHSSA